VCENGSDKRAKGEDKIRMHRFSATCAVAARPIQAPGVTAGMRHHGIAMAAGR
jgi:hypothetical protein